MFWRFLGTHGTRPAQSGTCSIFYARRRGTSKWGHWFGQFFSNVQARFAWLSFVTELRIYRNRDKSITAAVNLKWEKLFTVVYPKLAPLNSGLFPATATANNKIVSFSLQKNVFHNEVAQIYFSLKHARLKKENSNFLSCDKPPSLKQGVPTNYASERYFSNMWLVKKLDGVAATSTSFLGVHKVPVRYKSAGEFMAAECCFRKVYPSTTIPLQLISFPVTRS